jgi:ABC-type transporter Mla subunit MlaD
VALAIHDERLTRRVGAAVLLIAALTVVFVVMVLPRIEHGGVDVKIRFGEATGIGEGAPVRVAGRSIGHVRKIAIAPGGRGGGIVVEVRFDRGWAERIPVNSDFFVTANSPLAPRFVAIGPPPGHANPARAVLDGDEVYGVDPPNLDRILQRTWENLTEVKQFLETLRPATTKLDAAAARLELTVRGLAPRPGTWEDLDARVSGAIAEARAVFADLRDGHLDPDRLAHLAASVDACSAHIGDALGSARARIAEVRTALSIAGTRADRSHAALGARLDATLASADRALATAQALTEQLGHVVRDAGLDGSGGRGSIAAFAADLELVDDVKAMTKQLKNAPWRVMAPPSE